MSILCDRDTKLVVQGLGRAGQFHTQQLIAYGTQVVAGVHPRRAGETQQFSGQTDHSGASGRSDEFTVDLPIFSGVGEAVAATGATASLILVPPPFAADSIMEAAEAEVELIVCITEGVPVNDMVMVKRYLQSGPSRLLGPNCPGVITPGECKLGIMPGYIHARGKVGVISRSGTLTYEAVYQLTNLGLGQTTALGIGGDPVNGTSFVDALALFEADPATEGVLVIGEIGGSAEEEAAEFVRSEMTKPVAGFIAGLTAPPGKRMGHAGAIISGGQGTAASKLAAFRRAGIEIAPTPPDMGSAMLAALGG